MTSRLLVDESADSSTLRRLLGQASYEFFLLADVGLRGARDMSDAEIVRAIANLEASGLPIASAVHVLNHWRY